MAWLKIIFNLFYSKIDAFDYDHEAGAISNRRTAVQIDPALGVSLQIVSGTAWKMFKNMGQKDVSLSCCDLLAKKKGKISAQPHTSLCIHIWGFIIQCITSKMYMHN